MDHWTLSDIKDLTVAVIGAVATAYIAIAVQLSKMHATSRDTNSKVNGNIDSLVGRIEELHRALREQLADNPEASPKRRKPPEKVKRD